MENQDLCAQGANTCSLLPHCAVHEIKETLDFRSLRKLFIHEKDGSFRDFTLAFYADSGPCAILEPHRRCNQS